LMGDGDGPMALMTDLPAIGLFCGDMVCFAWTRQLLPVYSTHPTTVNCNWNNIISKNKSQKLKTCKYNEGIRNHILNPFDITRRLTFFSLSLTTHLINKIMQNITSFVVS
jgi:hypothetical protein